MKLRVPHSILFVGLCITLADPAAARNPIRRAFFNVYPEAEGSVLDDVPSSSSHCGVCHFDFDGSDIRNAYGLQVEIAINSGNYGSHEEAIIAIQDGDSDNDGFSNLIEIMDTTNFGNTPTFPGLSESNVGNVYNVDIADIEGHLTPSGGSDTTPPDVTVTSPNGGESYDATTVQTITWIATDASGISSVDIYLSDDNGVTFKPIIRDEEDEGYADDWFVANRPGTQNIIRVVAYDGAGNSGSDESDAVFTIVGVPGGVVPTTLRDFDLPGTQPLEGATLDDPEGCRTCHGDYNPDTEQWFPWRGSMMGQAMRDPLFEATMIIAEQAAPSSGDLCIRCHTPGGWQEGRSVDTSGGLLTEKDRQGIHCDFCHRSVDPDYKEGISPPEDLEILNALDEIPLNYANGQFVSDPDPIRRGPYADADASHAFLESPFHRESDICGTCHDVSNPAFVLGDAPGKYEPNDFDTPHPDGDLRNMFPVERTFSEWSVSEYATDGVYAPEFAGNLPDGIVSSCQDCHMRDVTGKGCSEQGAPNRDDLPFHDLTGGNHFVGDILPDFYPDQVDVSELQAGKTRAISMLSLAASMELTAGQSGGNPSLDVKITNEGGHKLPSGYPEGRRIWINVKAYDGDSNLIYESGAYDLDTGVLSHDDDIKIYQTKPGVSVRLGSLLGLPPGPSFHFVLSDTVYSDNRIPPRGFTNASFDEIQSPPVGYAYADSQYWDTTTYVLPVEAATAVATLYYQTTSKEYIEFLRDENITNDLGQRLYDAWVAHGRAAPIAMVTGETNLDTPTDVAETGAPRYPTALLPSAPMPFKPPTRVTFSLAARSPVSLRIYDTAGRLVRTLVDEAMDAGLHHAVWDGRGDAGERVSAGIYIYRMVAGGSRHTRKIVLVQ